MHRFKYLGSSVEGTGGMTTEITQRVSAACDRRMPVKLKGTVYKTGQTSVDLGNNERTRSTT